LVYYSYILALCYYNSLLLIFLLALPGQHRKELRVSCGHPPRHRRNLQRDGTGRRLQSATRHGDAISFVDKVRIRNPNWYPGVPNRNQLSAAAAYMNIGELVTRLFKECPENATVFGDPICAAAWQQRYHRKSFSVWRWCRS